MPITTHQVTTYICDRCGYKTEDKNSVGLSNLTLTAQHDYLTNGTHSGHQVKSWLCGLCRSDFMDYMRGHEVAALDPDQPKDEKP